MLKCPYCFEVLEEKTTQCPHCDQFIIDTIIESEFRSLDKKKCFFCGKKILKESRVCRHCKQWLDSVDSGANDYDQI